MCLGHQAVGQAFGAAVVRAPRLVHGKTSEIVHDGRGVFRDLGSPMVATRYHSLVVDEPLPGELVRTAWTDRSSEGEEDELMGIRHRTLPIEGVQFHPESYLSPDGPALLANFLASARQAVPLGGDRS